MTPIHVSLLYFNIQLENVDNILRPQDQRQGWNIKAASFKPGSELELGENRSNLTGFKYFEVFYPQLPLAAAQAVEEMDGGLRWNTDYAGSPGLSRYTNTPRFRRRKSKFSNT